MAANLRPGVPETPALPSAPHPDILVLSTGFCDLPIRPPGNEWLPQ
ncbi:MAG: hypothetical protein HWQ43_30855 [Nostoc sp. JL31]|nr:hypothetical protein [Nostoc sp. JL31]MBN3893333.1 hypothetical protein [Nostoc sp. JL31]